MTSSRKCSTANEKYAAEFGDKTDLALRRRADSRFTCMDARLDPAQYAGLSEGDAHVSAMPEGAPATTPCARWSSPTSCSARVSGSSSITPTAVWNSSPTRGYGLLANSLETAALGADGFYRRRPGPGFGRGEIHRLGAHDQRRREERDADVKPDPVTPARPGRQSRSTGISTTSRPDACVEVPDATTAGAAGLSAQPDLAICATFCGLRPQKVARSGGWSDQLGRNGLDGGSDLRGLRLGTGRNRPTTVPSGAIKNFSKFHWMSPAATSASLTSGELRVDRGRGPGR